MQILLTVNEFPVMGSTVKTMDSHDDVIAVVSTRAPARR